MPQSTSLPQPVSPSNPIDKAKLQAAMQRACATIMPAWPLDQAVAVNPHWRRVHQPIRHVAAQLAVLGDGRVFPDRGYIHRAWQQGRITHADLDAALHAQATQQTDAPSAEHCIAELSQPLRVTGEPLLVDLLDDTVQKNKRWPWRAAIVFQLSQVCATYFDRHQADWRATGAPRLYDFWRDSIIHDHGLPSMLGVSGLAQQLQHVPHDAAEAARWAMQTLALPPAAWDNYCQALLLSINGWAAWCAYIQWQNIPKGKTDQRLPDLLIARLVWEALLARCSDDEHRQTTLEALTQHWNDCDARVSEARTILKVDEIWQQALDISYQRELAAKLSTPAASHTPQTPKAQAVFCIDTRSEAMRRALEAIMPDIETRAFAGFFGIPAHYNLLGTDIQRPQLPGLSYPSVAIQDVVTAPGEAPDAAHSNAPQTQAVATTRHKHLARLDQWLGAICWSNATFSFVEAFGIGYLGKIWRWIKPSTKPRTSIDRLGLPTDKTDICRPVITGLDTAERVALAADILHVMGLDDRLAPLVVLCGHAGHCTNNAHASTLDCGACYGRPGEANARALAALLNAADVRTGLRQHGLTIPDHTVFVGALHNTTTDEVTGFDLDLLSPAAQADWAHMAHVFAEAGTRIRRERAPGLWMDPKRASLAAFRRRANNGAQTRPEWGLTRNATFLIGPRERSRERFLNRTYLHDYDSRYDADANVLEKLMMGPMLVTHWLSWQYHASTCDPHHYGAGNKVLHNVVDGHVGVFEGNGGDLRIGLPRQSLHNGTDWQHDPVRLTVIIDAPAADIEAIIARNAILGQLFDNGWMLLWRYEGDTLQRYEQGRWLPLEF